eukprot:m.100785 g.100785  ORF g.100785 m.100785 type:complete len:115 (+) comp37097_c0_seq2:1290-1634(+)
MDERQWRKQKSLVVFCFIPRLTLQKLGDKQQFMKSIDFARERLKLGITLADIVLDVQAAESKREAKRLIKAGGVYINDVRILNPGESILDCHVTEEGVTLLRTGKTDYYMIKWT